MWLLRSSTQMTLLCMHMLQKDAASRRVDDLVDAWEHEGILRAVFVESSIIHTHPPFIIILFQD
jgi:hypothetical protein